jgi:hypothetical protein
MEEHHVHDGRRCGVGYEGLRDGRCGRGRARGRNRAAVLGIGNAAVVALLIATAACANGGGRDAGDVGSDGGHTGNDNGGGGEQPREHAESIPLTTAAADTALPVHPSELAWLNKDATFPRFTPEELASAGFPDHMHVFGWPGFEPRRDETGRTYGPWTLCERAKLIPRPDLEIESGEIRYGSLKLRYEPPELHPCAVLRFVEFFDQAVHDYADWLGLTRDDTLLVESPLEVPQYTERTGYGIWHLYRWLGPVCVVEPVKVLVARTLVGHGAYRVAFDWLLRAHGGERLPAWLRDGLGGYFAEDGVHLTNFMAEFRVDGPVLFPPAIADSLLSAPPDPNPMRDRYLYRRARYTAFLMVWELVENRGGLKAVRAFLDAVDGGENPDAAARRIWGADLVTLATQLDPQIVGEPLGTALQPRYPHKAPESWQRAHATGPE